MLSNGTLDGPWGGAFWFALPFAPQSKSNFRRQGQSRSWASQRGFESQVATLAATAVPAGWDLGDASKPLASRSVMVVTIVATSPLDTANLSKSILDALEGVAFVNDAQVRSIASLSERHRDNQRALVAIAALPPPASLPSLAECQAELTRLAVDTFASLTP